MTEAGIAGLAVCVLAAALFFGPLPIAVRGLLRGPIGVAAMRRWTPSVYIGAICGMLGATAFVALVRPELTIGTALLSLLFLLAVIDWQWRWLPIEWTVAVIALGMLFALQSDAPAMIILQMLVPAAALLIARQTLLWMLKKEALGLGDIWLVAGLGAFLEPFQSFLLIGFAAFSGLLEVSLRRWFMKNGPKRHGVAYGTHLCIIFIIMQNLGSLG